MLGYRATLPISVILGALTNAASQSRLEFSHRTYVDLNLRVKSLAEI